MRVDVEVARLASERAAAVIRREMGRGRASLSAIAGTASLMGMLKALMDLKKAFPAMFDPPPIYGDGAGGPSEALVPVVMGLCATILALWVHSYMCAQLEKFDTEMRAATLELANSLSLLRQRN